MTYDEALVYYDKLTVPEAHRFNLLVTIAAKLGKSGDETYTYAHTIMEDDKKECKHEETEAFGSIIRCQNCKITL
jgi:hypothetical protein